MSWQRGDYLQGDVIAGGEALVDRSQGRLFDVPDALVDVVDGGVALPLPRSFIPGGRREGQSDMVCPLSRGEPGSACSNSQVPPPLRRSERRYSPSTNTACYLQGNSTKTIKGPSDKPHMSSCASRN